MLKVMRQNVIKIVKNKDTLKMYLNNTYMETKSILNTSSLNKISINVESDDLLYNVRLEGE